MILVSLWTIASALSMNFVVIEDATKRQGILSGRAELRKITCRSTKDLWVRKSGWIPQTTCRNEIVEADVFARADERLDLNGFAPETSLFDDRGISRIKQVCWK
ncbi:MAG: hypothetical protein JST85_29695 [Acidobacteria bacterium]|nr:hypothetical protein [Acidobacteriota bacterium]